MSLIIPPLHPVKAQIKHNTISSGKSSFNDSAPITTLKRISISTKKSTFSTSSLTQNSSLCRSLKINKTKSKILLSPLTKGKIERIPITKISKALLINSKSPSIKHSLYSPGSNNTKSRQKVFLLQKDSFNRGYNQNNTYNLFSSNVLDINMNHFSILKFHKELNESIAKLNKYTKENNNYDKRFLTSMLKSYFVTLRKINISGGFDSIFISDKKLNVLFVKFIKSQILIYTILFIAIQFLSIDDLLNMISNGFYTVFNEFSVPFSTFCATFIFNHFSSANMNNMFMSVNNNTYGDIAEIESITKYYMKKYYKNQKIKQEHLMLSFNKSLDKCFQNINFYISFTFKFSKLKQYSEAIEECLLSNLPLKSIIILITNHVIYSQLNPIISTIHINIDTNSIDNNNILDTSSDEKPFLPKLNTNEYKYSLVVDLDETLIHSFIVNEVHQSYFIRPFCFEFLNELSSIFEIIIFTAGTKEYADNILDQIDKKNNIIKHRLYRDHLTFGNDNKSILKDLSKLGRDLKKTIIVDNVEENYTLQKDNGLLIKTWDGNFNDRELFDIKNLLKDTASALDSEEEADIRKVIRGVNKEIKKNRKERPYKDINVSCIMEI